jgi:hypothetical protein
VTKDRLDFLCRLQVDYPEHLLFYQCASFHCHLGGWFWGSTDFTACDSKTRVFEDSSVDLYLPFSRAQEVMNRHQNGWDYGSPVSDFGYNFDYNSNYRPHTDFFYAPGWRERRRLSGRVVNGELLVKIDRSRLFLFGHPETKRWRRRFFMLALKTIWTVSLGTDSARRSKKKRMRACFSGAGAVSAKCAA